MDNVIYVEEMKNIVERINLCRKDEILLFEDLKQSLSNINNCYNLKIKKEFNEKEFELIEKYSTFIKIHENNIFVLNKNIEKYLSTSIKVSKTFSEIND